MVVKGFGEQSAQMQEVHGICQSCAPHPLRTWQRQTDSGKNGKIYLWWVIIFGRPPQMNDCMGNCIFVQIFRFLAQTKFNWKYLFLQLH